MKAYSVLPEGYKEFYSVDLQKDKKTAVVVNIIAVVIAAAMVLPMHRIVPVSTLYKSEEGIVMRMMSMVVLLIAYIILHEAVHGISMKPCGTKKIKYGFTGAYAFSGSDDYYPKKAYIFIALSPVVLWGVVLAVVNSMVPEEWFWIIYIVQIMNISGAAGDFFVTVKFLRFPDDILVRDHGVGMRVYSKK